MITKNCKMTENKSCIGGRRDQVNNHAAHILYAYRTEIFF